MADNNNVYTKLSELQICTICNLTESPKNKGGSKDKWISCVFCDGLLHTSCAEISDKAYAEYKSKKSYFCLPCMQIKIKSKASRSDPSTVISDINADKLENQIKQFMPQLEVLISKMVATCIKESIDEVKRDINRLNEKTVVLERRIDDLEDHIRAKNIVIRGCPDMLPISPKVIVERIAVKLGFRLNSHEIISAQRLWSRSHSKFNNRNIDQTKADQSKISKYPTLILVVFSSLEVKSAFLKAFHAYIKVNPIKISDLFPCNQNQDKMLDAGIGDHIVYIGDHLNKKSLDCWHRIRKLLKDGIIYKASIRRGRIWIQNKNEDEICIRSIVDLQKYVPGYSLDDVNTGGGGASKILS